MKRWRSAGVVVTVDEDAKTIRIRDSQLILLAVGIAFALTASAPHLVVRLRPLASITFSGYVISATFAAVALLCLSVHLRHKANDVTIDLAKRIVEYRSGMGRSQTHRLADVTFTTRMTSTEALGNSVQGVAVQMEAGGLDLNVLRFTADQESVVDGFTGILANAAEQDAERTLASFSAHAEKLPPHMMGQILGALALMVGGAVWFVLAYLLRTP